MAITVYKKMRERWKEMKERDERKIEGDGVTEKEGMDRKDH